MTTVIGFYFGSRQDDTTNDETDVILTLNESSKKPTSTSFTLTGSLNAGYETAPLTKPIMIRISLLDCKGESVDDSEAFGRVDNGKIEFVYIDDKNISTWKKKHGTYYIQVKSPKGVICSDHFSLSSYAKITPLNPNVPAQAINTNFAMLQVSVKDAKDQPIDKAEVTFTIIPGSSGAGGSFKGTSDPLLSKIVTNTNGVATSDVIIANDKLGIFTVEAASFGATDKFTLTITPPPPPSS